MRAQDPLLRRLLAVVRLLRARGDEGPVCRGRGSACNLPRGGLAAPASPARPSGVALAALALRRARLHALHCSRQGTVAALARWLVRRAVRIRPPCGAERPRAA